MPDAASHARRLPREALWFFVGAPPVLALLFDPHCATTVDNVLRAWLALTLYTLLTGVAVHVSFEWLARRLEGRPVAARVGAHVIGTAVVVAAMTLVLFVPVSWIYPEIGSDVLGVIWRGVIIGLGYVGTARLVGRLQEQAVAERTRAHAERTAALEARLAALQAQMQPHFLFNSLNVCAGLVHGSPDAAEATLDKLSAFLRYTIESSERRFVPLTDELAAVSAYLDIQRERFGDRLRHEIVAPADGSRAPSLPPMALQPLVENAVVHGLGDEGGLVRITCREERERFVITVEDGGGGGPSRGGTGTGQRNLRERLRLMYGEAAELVCGRTPAGGYASVISLPLAGTP